jgi:hypothetical protein
MALNQPLPISIRLMLDIYNVRLPADAATREQALTAAVDVYLKLDALIRVIEAELATLKASAPRLPPETEYFQEVLIHEALIADYQQQLDPLEQRLLELSYESAAAENALIDLLPVGVSVRVGEYAVLIVNDWRFGKYARVAPWQQRHITRADLTGGE